MVQKKIQNRQGIKKGTKKNSLKEMKEKFVEEPLSMYTVTDHEGPKPSLQKTKFTKDIKKAEMDRGIGPMHSHIRSISPRDQSRELVTIDRSGRLVLPKKIRNRFDANRFEVKATENHIELIPIQPLQTLFGILPEINMEKLYREHDREVEEEGAE